MLRGFRVSQAFWWMVSDAGVGGEGQVGVLFLPSRLSLSFRMGLQTLPPRLFLSSLQAKMVF